MAVKVVIFDLFDTLISEFRLGSPFTHRSCADLTVASEGISAGIPESSIRTTYGTILRLYGDSTVHRWEAWR